ncbi:hypothetical protein L7F22_066110 [Adiantum nelumboides]|nr:hypothetical protein [Adiantum nelumboides]
MTSAALAHIFGAVAGEQLRNKLEEHSDFWLETAELVGFIVQDRLLVSFWLETAELLSGSGSGLISAGSGLWLVSGQDWLLVSGQWLAFGFWFWTDSSLMAKRSQQLDWQEIHLSEDEASAQGTHAVRFLVQQVEKVQNNSLLRPMLNNLMRAHGLQLLNYEPPTQDPTFQEVLNEGNTREEREVHSQDDAFSGRSRSPSRRTRRPLEREANSLRNRVQESGSKRRRSPSHEVSSSPSPRANEEVRDIRVAFDKIKESIQYAQQKYKRAADKHRKSLQFKDGDWVLLRFTKARLKTTTGKNWKGEPTGHQKYYMKLAKQYYGPFQILSRINVTAYKLRLPANWHIHNAFHVSLLKPFKGDPPTEPVQEEPPLFDDKEEVLQLKEILRHEENILCSGKVIRRYLVKFKHYSNEDSKWMQETQ